MLYSRFNEAEGVYDVFEDGLAKPVNADMPVPSMPAVANGIGAPASLSGRPLPSGTRYVGTSWHAKGLIVSPSSRGPIGSVETANGVLMFMSVAGLTALSVWLFLHYERQRG
jgi:hypothetical protein